ncbi:MAG TPA: hypothetical protein VKT72_17580 [Candidatus Baltobacteraceae bacterium]|nr:hypothetical protein [Candidatus Baltobacteraceae bacterium]
MSAMLRAVFSLAASCYIIAALVFPGFWLADDLRLPPALWWPAYLCLEFVLLGLPISFAVWRLVWEPAASLQPLQASHFGRLASRTLAVIYGFLVVPAGCFISLPHRANLYPGFITFAAAAIASAVYLKYARGRAPKFRGPLS